MSGAGYALRRMRRGSIRRTSFAPGTATSAWHRAGSRGAGSRWPRPAGHWRAAGGQPEAGIRDLCNLITIAALFDYVLLSQTRRPDPAAGRWGSLLEGARRRCPEERGAATTTRMAPPAGNCAEPPRVPPGAVARGGLRL